MGNNEDPDQMTSSEAIFSGSILFEKNTFHVSLGQGLIGPNRSR